MYKQVRLLASSLISKFSRANPDLLISELHCIVYYSSALRLLALSVLRTLCVRTRAFDPRWWGITQISLEI